MKKTWGSMNQKPAGWLGAAETRSLSSLQISLCIFVFAWTLPGLVGCGAFESRTQRITLSDSGFLARVPQTERQRDFYAALPPYKLYQGVKNGRPFYVYKDEKAGVVYVGNEQDYQHYLARVKRLISYYETTEAKMMAHNIDESVQARWDGSWSRESRESSRHGNVTAAAVQENTPVPAPTPSRNLNFNGSVWD